MSIEPLLQHAIPFLLVATRIGGIFLIAPMLAGSSIPLRVRALFTIAFAAMVYPLLTTQGLGVLPHDLLALAPALAGEAVIGATIGLIALIPFVAVQIAGTMMGQQMGLAIADIIDPSIDIPGANLGQFLFYLTLGAFISLGGFEVLFSVLTDSFATVPLMALRPTAAPLDVIIGVLGSGFDLAIRVAMPVLTIIFLENIAVGFIMKTVPSLNIMSFGFPIRILAGLIIFLMALPFMKEAILVELKHVLDVIRAIEWAP